MTKTLVLEIIKNILKFEFTGKVINVLFPHMKKKVLYLNLVKCTLYKDYTSHIFIPLIGKL